MKTVTKLWIGLGALALLSPIGLFLPEYFKAGDAWGEWGTDTIKDLVGYVPAGLEKISSLWSAPLADYAFKGQEAASLGNLSFSYIISAVVGIALCVGGAFLLGKLLARKDS
jgi:cobalt/nickel transport protein